LSVTRFGHAARLSQGFELLQRKVRGYFVTPALLLHLREREYQYDFRSPSIFVYFG
jgi:hypothetical protein